MTVIATAHIDADAPPAAFFERWADTATWPEWNLDTEWVRLDGPFQQGACGTLKPKGGPKVPFVVESLVDGREFIDVSRLFGARLTFAHHVTPTGPGCRVDVRVTMTGPLARLWTRILGPGLRTSLLADLERLAGLVERPGSASG
ncbi:MAG TPA: SRPBCC family protein [Jatrophihabitans sp.]|jgi:hypothetical protein|nr:SRPBCC family protein [Jatrophihabitans sp.]